MKYVVLILLMVSTCMAVFGQQGKLDSLDLSLSHMGVNAKAKYAVNLAGKKLDSRTDDALEFANWAVRWANQTDKWQLQAEALGYLSEAQLQIRDTIPAIISLEKLLTIFSSNHDIVGEANVQLKLCQLYLFQGDMDKSKLASKAALSQYQNATDTIGMAAAYNAMAAISEKSGEVQMANENLKVALNYLNHKTISEERQIQALNIQKSQEKRIRGLLFVLMGIAGFMAAMLSILYKKKQVDNHKLAQKIVENQLQKTEIEELVKEQEMKNISLALLNKKLLDEIAAREKIQGFSHSKDRYLAAITHEMRSPLNDIAGLAQLLLENSPRPDQLDQIRVLQFCANELTSLTNEALGYSNFEDAKFSSHHKEFVLGELMHQLYERIALKATQKGIIFHQTTDELIPKYLMGNGPRFSNVLTNILINCLETTTVGVVNCTVILEDKTQKEAIIKVLIETPDKGALSNIYYHKGAVTESTNANDERVLSLAMTKRMVEIQSGRMQVENILDEATRFTLYFPFPLVGMPHISYQLSDGKYESLNGANVLLVEDNKINQVVVVKALSKHGAIVSTAENGMEALDLLEQKGFDVVLMDIQMPVMDGYRATSEIRKNPSHAINTLPIIALTSSAYIVEKEKALLFGMNDYIGKPYAPNELLEKITECLEISRKLS